MNLSLFDMAGDTPLLNPEIVEQVAAINSVAEASASARIVKIDALRSAAVEFAALIGAGVKLTWDRAAEVMTRLLNGTDADGAWTPQDLYNAAESGLVRTIVSRPLPTDASSVLAELDGLDSLLPPRRRRSEEGILLQQFSTPSPYAWLASVAAGVTANDIVLEPSAGTGLLAVFAKLAGAKLVVNELDTSRLGLLDHLDAVSATDHDARYLSALYRGEKPTVVVMNPPFSIDHNLGGDRRVRALALSHVDQAMRTVRRGGRVVAIVGHNQSPAEHSDLWDDILTRATIRAAVAIDGSSYKHMGTTFGTAIVVLDATLDVQKPVLYKSPVSLAEAYGILAEITPRTNLLEGASRHAGGQVVSLEAVRTRVETIAPFAFKEKPEPVKYAIRGDVDAMQEDGRYAHYAPQTILIEGATAHPTPLVESAALACVRPPVPTYVPLLPPILTTKGELSEAQLEAVIYAGDAHQKTLEIAEENEEHQRISSIVTRGWMSGFGTGFGKGRVNAAIIADNFAHGRKKAIWFSESPTLQEDARRDWRALTGDDSAIFSFSGIPVDVRIERAHGILFCTYATLRSKSKKSTRTRVEQIIEWVGEDFDGALIFDESHNLANAVPAKSEDGALKALQSGSQQGMAALDLQRRLPRARIVYVSATSASKIDALAYAPRLGLWGIGTAFPTREQFLSTMGSGGTAAFELLCRDMKALGFYLSASLSYDGVTYERLIHKLDEDQQAQFNVVAGAWRMILANVHSALESSNASSLAKAAALSGLESTRLRSLQAVTVSQKVPTLIVDAERELEAGRSVVIQLTNTNEAIQERALAKLGDEGDLDEVNLSGAEIMLDFVDRCFPTIMYHDRATEDGGVVSVPLLDGDGSPVHNPEALAMRDNMKTMIATVLAPVGPIEMILDHFGPDAVAEITGRSRRIVMRSVNGQMQRVLEDRGAHANLAEMQGFRDGKKRVLLFSEGAGGTGFSYHADRAAANQQKRIHYLLQTGYRSDRALQGMGRTHRTNQAIAPCYKLVCTDIPGEMRFISVIARRLESLGALTRGQRDAASGGIFDPSDNLETTWGELAVGALLRTIATKGIEGLSYAQWFAQTGLSLYTSDDKIKAEQIPVSRFLNRVLCCDLGPNGGVQGLIMDGLMEQLEATIEAAKQSGKFDHGIQTIPALSLKKLSENVVHRHEESGCTTSVIEIEAQVPREAKTFGQVVSYVRRAREKHGHASAFFFQHPEYGIACCYPTAATRQERNRVIPLAKIITPMLQTNIDQAFTNGYVRSVIDDAMAEAQWKKMLEEGGDTVTQHYTMIAGTLLPIYDRLPDDNPIVYRLTLDDGERLIGRVISEAQRAGTLARLGVETKADPARAYSVVKSGARVALANGWQIKTSRLNGVPRLEVMVPAHQIMRVKSGLTARGLIAETVAYAVRFFIPTGAEEPVIFHKLIEDLSLAA